MIFQMQGISHLRGTATLANLGFKFPIGMFRYRRGGSKADWVVILRFPRGASTSNSNFIQTIATASKQAPENL